MFVLSLVFFLPAAVMGWLVVRTEGVGRPIAYLISCLFLVLGLLYLRAHPVFGLPRFWSAVLPLGVFGLSMWVSSRLKRPAKQPRQSPLTFT